VAVRLSLNITDFSSSKDPAGIGAWLGRIARAADESGLEDTLWVAVYLLQADPNSSLDAQMLEAYTTRVSSRPRPSGSVWARWSLQ
jgi:hypothetical protein